MKRTIIATALMAISASALASNYELEATEYSVDVIVASDLSDRNLDPKTIDYSGNPNVLIEHFEDNDIWYNHTHLGNYTVDALNEYKVIEDKYYSFDFDEATYERGGKYELTFNPSGSVDIDINFRTVDRLDQVRDNLYLDVNNNPISLVLEADVDSLVIETDYKDMFINDIVVNVETEEGQDISNNITNRKHYFIINRK